MAAAPGRWSAGAERCWGKLVLRPRARAVLGFLAIAGGVSSETRRHEGVQGSQGPREKPHVAWVSTGHFPSAGTPTPTEPSKEKDRTLWGDFPQGHWPARHVPKAEQQGQRTRSLPVKGPPCRQGHVAEG